MYIPCSFILIGLFNSVTSLAEVIFCFISDLPYARFIVRLCSSYFSSFCEERLARNNWRKGESAPYCHGQVLSPMAGRQGQQECPHPAPGVRKHEMNVSILWKRHQWAAQPSPALGILLGNLWNWGCSWGSPNTNDHLNRLPFPSLSLGTCEGRQIWRRRSCHLWTHWDEVLGKYLVELSDKSVKSWLLACACKPTRGRLRCEGHEFKASLMKWRHCSPTQKKTKKKSLRVWGRRGRKVGTEGSEVRSPCCAFRGL